MKTRIVVIPLLDLLIDVNDARRMLWSHIANDGQLRDQTEAREIMKLLQQQKVLTNVGIHKVPSLASATMAYNLAVAHKLKRLAGR